MSRTGSMSVRLLGAASVVCIALGAIHTAPPPVHAQTSAPGQMTVARNDGDKNIAPRSSADLIKASAYELKFGPGPFLPSEAKSDFTGFLKPEDIPTAAYCGKCHADLHAQWRQSAHANSFRAPWYIKNVNELSDTKGIAFTRHCEGCHNPSALFTGALTPGSKVSRPNDDDGITCMVCHSIRKVEAVRGTGSYIMGKPAVLIDDNGNAVAGLPSDAEILSHLDWHKRAVMQPLYKTSEFCGACHKAALPRMVNGYKWLRTFSTYDEWQQSSWSTETPLPFYKKPAPSGCQECHMLREAGKDPAEPGGQVYSHRWLGANTAVPTQYGFDEQARRVVEYLKADKMEVDIFGITVEHAPKPGNNPFVPGSLQAPLGSHPLTVLPGDWVRVDVVVRNKGIGHALIPELRDFYESWIDFEATDDAGHSLFHSGGIDANHRLDPLARSYVLQIAGQDGKGLDHHEVWKTYVKGYDATVMPGRSDVIRYRFQVPPDVKGFTVSASVRYRRFKRIFTDWVFGDQPTAPDRFPTVTMATGTFHISAGANAPHPQTTLAPDMTDALRWNNYGIGMLDRLQFAEAAEAFRNVVKLDANYEAGYVNVAIAEYSRGRYADSLSWLDRAAAMDPNDARAQYYRGLNLRWQGHFDQAIAVMKPVGERYPRFRQVHQELGYMLMIQRRYAESKAEYETVLAVDPDDPTTHRWLGPVLAALGDKAGAMQEAKLAADRGVDTAAGWMAQRFWREHIDIASEAMPGHTYSPGGTMDDADVHKVLNLQNPPSYIWVENFSVQ